jgi:hypothetical protein
MQGFKHSVERSSLTQPSGALGRTLSNKRYLELGRQQRLGDLPARRPPYIEAAVTAAAFLFLLLLIFAYSNPARADF